MVQSRDAPVHDDGKKGIGHINVQIQQSQDRLQRPAWPRLHNPQKRLFYNSQTSNYFVSTADAAQGKCVARKISESRVLEIYTRKGRIIRAGPWGLDSLRNSPDI